VYVRIVPVSSWTRIDVNPLNCVPLFVDHAVLVTTSKSRPVVDSTTAKLNKPPLPGSVKLPVNDPKFPELYPYVAPPVPTVIEARADGLPTASRIC